MRDIRHLYSLVNGVNVCYREAGNPENPTLLLLHGFPSSSIQFRYMLAELSERWHLVAPDLPGFGFSEISGGSSYEFTFKNLIATIRGFIDKMHLNVRAAYIHDYGAQIGFRLLVNGAIQPDALVIQNSEAYHGVGWNDAMWAMEKRLSDTVSQSRSRLTKTLLIREGIQKEFFEDLPADITCRIDPAIIELAWNRINDPHTIEAMVSLHMDYGSNIQFYPEIQTYFRTTAIPTLLLWGRRDQYLSIDAAHAYRQDLPNLNLITIDGGHWLLESHIAEVNAAVFDFFVSHLS